MRLPIFFAVGLAKAFTCGLWPLFRRLAVTDRTLSVHLLFALVTAVLAGLLAVFPVMGDNVPTNGLIGYWPGNGNALDYSPTSNAGEFGGAYAAGPTGQAFNLATGKVSIANNAAYNFTSYNGWSVGFWFNGNGTPIGAETGLFLGQDNGSGFKPKWFIEYGYSVYEDGPYYFLHVNDYNQERIFVNSLTENPPTGWNQLTVTVNNTNDGAVAFYLNGEEIGTGGLGNYVLETTAPLVFGQAEGLSFNGLLSDVVIYNRVLATNEILQLVDVPTLAITNEPESVSVSTGGLASFSVGVVGFPPFQYQWLLNGAPIAGATNQVLSLTNISASDVGAYTVSVANQSGAAMSTPATLTTVDIKLFAGIIINGVVGTNYTLQSSPVLAATDWTTLNNFDLISTPSVYIDYSSITNEIEYYRAFANP